jgi:hypothetical protein
MIKLASLILPVGQCTTQVTKGMLTPPWNPKHDVARDRARGIPSIIESKKKLLNLQSTHVDVSGVI